MTYRDDHEAVLRRADALARELSRSEATNTDQGRRIEESDAELARKMRELAGLRKRLTKLDPTVRLSRRAGKLVAAVTIASVIVSAVVFFLVLHRTVSPEDATEQSPSASRVPWVITQSGDRAGALTRAQMRQGLAILKLNLQRCERLKSIDGAKTIKALISVSSNGRVYSSVQDSSNLGRCLRRVLSRARFGVSRRGRTFTHSFVFR